MPARFIGLIHRQVDVLACQKSQLPPVPCGDGVAYPTIPLVGIAGLGRPPILRNLLGSQHRVSRMGSRRRHHWFPVDLLDIRLIRVLVKNHTMSITGTRMIARDRSMSLTPALGLRGTC